MEYGRQFGNTLSFPTECCVMSMPFWLHAQMPQVGDFSTFIWSGNTLLFCVGYPLTVSPTLRDQDLGHAKPFPESIYYSTMISLVAEVEIESWRGRLSRLPTSDSGKEADK